MKQNRKTIKEVDTKAFNAMLTLEGWSENCSLSLWYKELIKIRASQINGCAYCLDMHTETALNDGVTARKIFAISVWHESHLFNEEERILLKLTEEITKISEFGVTDETYENTIKCFGEKLTSQIIMLVVIINSWNRIAVSTRQIYKP
jgi:AhpD family alkylhydroperoxidase